MIKQAFVRFETTLWDRIEGAQRGGVTALNELLGCYRGPIVNFLKRYGMSCEDAEDLAQEILLSLARHGALQKADPRRGRFRNLLLSITRHRMSNFRRAERAIKRGGRIREFSLDAGTDAFAPGEPAGVEDRDDQFDRSWMENLISMALKRLKEEQPESCRLIELQRDGERSYLDIAQELGKSEDWVDRQLRSARKKLAQFMRSEVMSYSSSPEEYQEELAVLSRYLGER